MTRLILCLLSVVLSPLSLLAADDSATLHLTLRHRVETAPGSGRYHTLTREESWDPGHTAIIVCDVWDLHHCLNAVRREKEFAPRLNEVLKNCRERGVTVIHSPSGCMDAYTDHPARLRAVNTPKADNLPVDIGSWCNIIPAEVQAVYPIDQSDGGEDDVPAEHAEWAAELESRGRNPKAPWKSESDLIEIDANKDYISDRGDEVWSILEAKGIDNVILTGVHANMCVLGRPFGLRQLAKNGKNVVLMRDMTDTMYNPNMWPYVSHFTGTDLIVEHVEKYVCPTITSDQVIGGKTFVFSNDHRPHVAIVMAEDEYETADTLPAFAAKYLGKDFRVSLVFGSETERNDIPGLDVLNDADVVLISIRRRTLPPEQLDIFRRFVAAGKPVVGIRTASHAFHVRNQDPPAGLDDWPEWDAQVFGGNYSNHYGNALQNHVQIITEQRNHPILTGIRTDEFAVGGSLYVTSPLAEGTTALMTGRVEGHDPEPVAWTFTRADGGRSFYTSLGCPSDFEGNPDFQRLLLNGIYWAAGLNVPEVVSQTTARQDYEQHWMPMPVPATWDEGSGGVLRGYTGPAWYRCFVRIPDEWGQATFTVRLKTTDPTIVWGYVNGARAGMFMLAGASAINPQRALSVPRELLQPGAVNLLVLHTEEFRPWGRRPDGTWIALRPGIEQAPTLTARGVLVNSQDGRHRLDRNHAEEFKLSGTWQFRIGDDPSFATLPLPAQFAASTDVVFDLSNTSDEDVAR
jgi:nicotinamidase-related amidase/type 1 glutamine amidotransferase